MFWVRKIFSFLLSQFFYQYAFQKAKRRAVVVYLRALQVMRRSLIATVFIFCLLQVMIFGFIGSIVAGIWIAPLDTESKIYILLAVCLTLFLLPLLGLCFALSEKTWLKASGALDMITSQNEN